MAIEARIISRILREGERFTFTIKCTTSTLDIRSVVPRIGSTLQVRGAISEAQVILHRAKEEAPRQIKGILQRLSDMLEAQRQGEADVIQIVVRLIPFFILRIVAVLILRRRACRVAQLFRAEVIDIIVSIRHIVRELPARGQGERVLQATIVSAIVHEIRGIVVAPATVDPWEQFTLL